LVSIEAGNEDDSAFEMEKLFGIHSSPIGGDTNLLKTKYWCPGWDSNPHSRCQEKDFKSLILASKPL